MMTPFAMINGECKEIMVGVTVDGHIGITIDPDPLGATFSWQTIRLTEDEAKAVRRSLMTAISDNKLRKVEE